ncbi:unnamed protein product [Tilletia controversa]|nr:unnamed protein product [Tilletia controversa]
MQHFGPLFTVASERFESFNAVVRQASIMSNRKRPSRDITRRIAVQETIRDALAEAVYFDPERQTWQKTGLGCSRLLVGSEAGKEAILTMYGLKSQKTTVGESVSANDVVLMVACKELTDKDGSLKMSTRIAKVYECNESTKTLSLLPVWPRPRPSNPLLEATVGSLDELFVAPLSDLLGVLNANHNCRSQGCRPYEDTVRHRGSDLDIVVNDCLFRSAYVAKLDYQLWNPGSSNGVTYEAVLHAWAAGQSQVRYFDGLPGVHWSLNPRLTWRRLACAAKAHASGALINQHHKSTVLSASVLSARTTANHGAAVQHNGPSKRRYAADSYASMRPNKRNVSAATNGTRPGSVLATKLSNSVTHPHIQSFLRIKTLTRTNVDLLERMVSSYEATIDDSRNRLGSLEYLTKGLRNQNLSTLDDQAMNWLRKNHKLLGQNGPHMLKVGNSSGEALVRHQIKTKLDQLRSTTKKQLFMSMGLAKPSDQKNLLQLAESLLGFYRLPITQRRLYRLVFLRLQTKLKKPFYQEEDEAETETWVANNDFWAMVDPSIQQLNEDLKDTASTQKRDEANNLLTDLIAADQEEYGECHFDFRHPANKEESLLSECLEATSHSLDQGEANLDGGEEGHGGSADADLQGGDDQ